MSRLVVLFVALGLLACAMPASAAIPFAPPQHWSFGLLGAVFSHSPFFGVALSMILWVIVSYSNHRDDDFAADPSGWLFAGTFLLASTMSAVGAFVGTMLVWLLRTPQLLDVRILYVDATGDRRTSKFNFIGFAILLASIFAIGAVYAARGSWTATLPPRPGVEIGDSLNTALLVTFTVLAVGLLIALIVLLIVERPPPYPGRRIAGSAQLKYIILLLLIVIIPASVFDSFKTFAPPLNLIFGALTLLAVWAFAFVYIIGVCTGGDTQIRGTREALAFALVVGGSHFAGYVIPLIAEFLALPPTIEPQIRAVTATIAIVSVVLVLIYVLLWATLWRTRGLAAYRRRVR